MVRKFPGKCSGKSEMKASEFPKCGKFNRKFRHYQEDNQIGTEILEIPGSIPLSKKFLTFDHSLPPFLLSHYSAIRLWKFWGHSNPNFFEWKSVLTPKHSNTTFGGYC